MTVVKINAITVPEDSGDELGRRFVGAGCPPLAGAPPAVAVVVHGGRAAGHRRRGGAGRRARGPRGPGRTAVPHVLRLRGPCLGRDHLQLPPAARRSALPALRAGRPVPDGARHPGHGHRPGPLRGSAGGRYRCTTGQVRVRVMPSIICTRLTTIFPSSSTVLDSARAITS